MQKALVTLMIAVLTAVTVMAQATVTPYGLAQYRLRLQIYSRTPDVLDKQSAMDYANQLAFFAGMKVKVNDQVSMQFQAGNDWVATDTINWGANNYWGIRGTDYPYFHLAYAKYDAGFLYVVAGIQPVASNGPLDLIDRSRVTGNYQAAGLVSWIVGTNNGLTGLKIGAPIVKGDFKLGVELLSTATSFRSQALAAEPKSNPSATMLLLDIPMSVSGLTIIPQAVVILNRNYDDSLEKGDHEVGGGFAASYKIMDGVTANACVGGAVNSNKNSLMNDVTPSAEFKNMGVIAGAGASIKAGPGNAIVDFKFSTDENKEVTDSKSSYIYIDAKYGWDANKNFQMMPRVRFFIANYPENNLVYDSKMEVRPELIFTGKF